MNSQQHIKNLLEKIGLTPSEAQFYMTVYANPKLTIAEIQQKAGMSLPTAYRC